MPTINSNLSNELSSPSSHARLRTQSQWSLIHASPGRIRLRVARLINDSSYAERLKYLLISDSYVTTIRFRPAAASVTIKYRLSITEGELSEAELRSHLISLVENVASLVEESDIVFLIPMLPKSLLFLIQRCLAQANSITI